MRAANASNTSPSAAVKAFFPQYSDDALAADAASWLRPFIGGAHRSNAELLAQGAANIASPLFGGREITVSVAATLPNSHLDLARELTLDDEDALRAGPRDFDRDLFMTATQAKEYGIIDEVITARSLADNTGPITRAS